MRKYVFSIIVVISILILGCSKKSKGFSKEVVNGVTQIENFEKEVEEQSVNPFITENEEKEIFLESVNDFTIDRDGNFYLLDRRVSQVLKFNKDGNFLKTIGSKGNGPSEFNSPDKITTRGEELIISQSASLRYTVYDLAGNFLYSKRSDDLMPGFMWVDKQDRIYTQKSPWMYVCPEDEPLLAVYDKNFELVDKIGKRKVDDHQLISLVKTQVCLAFTKDNSMIMAHKTKNKIEIFEDKKLQKDISRHLYIELIEPEYKVVNKTGSWRLISSRSVVDLVTDKFDNFYTVSPYPKKNSNGDKEVFYILEKFKKNGILEQIISLDAKIRKMYYSEYHNAIFFLEETEEEKQISQLPL